MALGSDFPASRKILEQLGPVEERTEESDGFSVRVDTPKFSMAIYEGGGKVRAVWYDDPAGRRLAAGKKRKVALYLQRYAEQGTWRHTMNNGWMSWWLNEIDDRLLVYGLHKDVIRFNDRKLS